jgi:hypothetical protein
LAYPPNIPLWVNAQGQAADVSATLLLDWNFTDPDPTDTQSAYALSKQEGAGALEYWRASDSTWQATEQKNIIGTTAVTLPTAWGIDADPVHTYKVKVWDQSDVASTYGDGLSVIPSAKVNPTVATPTEAQVLTNNSVTVTWTVAAQTAYRVKLVIFGSPLHDSGWVTSTALTYTIPVELADGFSYTIELQTKNAEGLASNVVTRNFSVNFIEPPASSIVATPSPVNGWVSVAMTNPAPVGTQPAMAYQDLWRRPVVNPILNANQGFEVNATGWVAVGGTGVRDTAFFKAGVASYKLTPDGVTSIVYMRSDDPKIPVTPGLSYHADGWIRAATVNKQVAVSIRWYDSGDVFLSETSTPVTPLVAGTFFYHGPIGTAPATATKMSVSARIIGTPAVGDIIWVDELRVRLTDPTEGVRVAKDLPANTTYEDWTAVSGVEYEWRSNVVATNETVQFGPWTP